jgi:hypothetical protein
MSEMSLVELRERLHHLKLRDEERVERRQREILVSFM